MLLLLLLLNKAQRWTVSLNLSAAFRRNKGLPESQGQRQLPEHEAYPRGHRHTGARAVWDGRGTAARVGWEVMLKAGARWSRSLGRARRRVWNGGAQTTVDGLGKLPDPGGDPQGQGHLCPGHRRKGKGLGATEASCQGGMVGDGAQQQASTARLPRRPGDPGHLQMTQQFWGRGGGCSEGMGKWSGAGRVAGGRPERPA